ncbi:uncharacterized protein MYCFIDRAFT_212314 [Pseudocercospora fijiensis CIRAD86]|uniref:Uncharacterized protein n=1 Tax=Pseudocercospora fijiensis (strain CIRAD86) TaxID=383855 RepID=M2YQ18_PSEFD|nr:uncharacterized protein MYCFIDRAFT_212314 [Pseudocercospora fijiensis CIRAD86]EME79810.1 hypothetical protein MYCFIDRAFT_212314 [Pseudocercospora fijiensis CIRAD86]
MSFLIRRAQRFAARSQAGLTATRTLSFATPTHAQDHISAWKESQDVEKKDDIVRETNEYSKTGSDDQVAQDVETAFGAKHTSPEAQLDQAAERSAKGNPLDVSPANPEVSKTSAQRPERVDLMAEKGVPRQCSGAGKSIKGGKCRTYDTEENQEVFGAGAAG